MSEKSRVQFMVVGAQKCGTSSICSILEKHSEINFSSPKETHFFTKHIEWHSRLGDYDKFFAANRTGMRGEGSTSYTLHATLTERIAEHIFQYNPAMKIIYVIRNPLDRFVSHYMHMYQRGRTSMGLTEAYRNYNQLVEAGKYATQIDPYIKRFGRQQVHIALFDSFVNSPEFFLFKICNFLNIDPDKILPCTDVHLNRSVGQNTTPYHYDRFLNSTSGKMLRQIVPAQLGRRILRTISRNQNIALSQKPILEKSIKNELIKIYQPEIQRIGALINQDLSAWLS